MMARHQRNDVPNKSAVVFDTNSFDIVIDSACSYCITNDASHFINRPQQINIPVKGIGGKQINATMKGTVKWSFANDNGQVHDEYISNTFYHKDSPYCLYSPQHVAQTANDHTPIRNGTMCTTYAKEMELVWDQRRQKRTIPINPLTNIFIMRSAPSNIGFHAYSNVIEQDRGDEFTINTPMFQRRQTDAHVIPNDDSDIDEINEGMNRKEETYQKEIEQGNKMYHPDLPIQFDIPERTFDGNLFQLPVEDVDIQAESDQAKLLAWHYRLGHIPFAKIQQMAARGDLPGRLARCQVPKCAACLYGKSTRRAWRTKAPIKDMTIPPATSPGAVVSVDQLISAVPGLIAQMKGFITHQRYNVATIFVDHFSGLSFVHLQKGSTVEETIEGKQSFERYAKTHGVAIKHYHADNGIFEAKGFQNALAMVGQTITFCGVNAHHQNGRAEKKIRDLQELARTMLLHAKQRWPKAINHHLWPYAVKMGNDISNRAPAISDGISPIEKFSQVAVAPQIKHSHTFGAPVYVLNSALQVAGKGQPKWDQRANIGIYLGTSPRHSRKVALVLSLKTGHVSPQFHVVIDDFFETLRPSAGNVLPISDWQKVTGFNKTKSIQRFQKSLEKGPDIPHSEILQWTENDTGINLTVDEIVQPTDTPQNEIQNQIPREQVVEQNQRQSDPASNTQSAHEILETVTRSGRTSRPTERLVESREQQVQGIVSLFVEWEVFHDESNEIQEKMDNPIAFLASTNPDVMYLDQAMKEPDRPEFEKAMVKEVSTHTKNGNWEIIKLSDVPKGTKVLPSVWAMRRKRRIETGEVYKWKARLNIHGGKQELGINYWDTYAPVIAWTTIRLYLVLALLNKRATRQIDFVLAYPQAEIECYLYMEIPRGF